MLSCLVRIIAGKLEGGWPRLARREQVEWRSLHDQLWSSAQVGTQNTALYQLIGLLLYLLHLLLGRMGANGINRYIRPIRSSRDLRTYVGAGRDACKERTRADEHNHGQQTQPGNQQKTQHLFETPAGQLGNGSRVGAGMVDGCPPRKRR